MQKFLLAAVTLALLAVGIVVFFEAMAAREAPDGPAGPAGEDELVQGLKPGDGRQLVLTHCVPCHSTSLVVSHRATRDGWDEIITRMQKEEGLWSFSTEDRTALLDYLEVTQGAVDTEQLARVTPWAEPLYRPNPIW